MLEATFVFANGLDPDPDRQNVGPDLGPTVWHSDSVPKRIFWRKNNFEEKKNSRRKQKHEKITQYANS